MCGIAGVWSPDEREARNAVAAMVRKLEHRGPDDEGLETIRTTAGVLVLGFRRLSIIDLTPAGHQPMHDPVTGNWVIFNGEIYNFRELRAELSALGESGWRSTSDTEVILKAYRRFGERCLERLHGMFAFAIWDARRQALLLARDRLGIKPLYYQRTRSALVFASEVRAILASGLVPATPCLEAVDSYLEFGAVQEPLTIVQDIRSLSAGSAAIATADEFEERSYWDLRTFRPQPNKVDEATAVAQVRTLLNDSVRRHLVADVPVGVFLSGGLDSSALVALSAMNAKEPVRTLSVVFEEPKYSEQHYSRLVAETFRTIHSEIRLSARELLEELEPALAAADQPTVDGINTYVVARAAQLDGLKVVLSGLGGDELFAGYASFRWNARLRLLQCLSPAIRRPFAMLVRRLFAGKDGWVKLADWLSGPAEGPPYFAMRQLFGPAVRSALLDGRASNWARMPGPTADVADDPVNEISPLELSYYMRNMLLRDSDAMSMAHGIELRVPMLDDALVGYVLGLPGRIKLSRGRVKPLLADAVADELPAAIPARRKVGFELPFQSWLRGPLAEEVAAVLLDRHGGGKLDEFLSRAAVERVWRRFEAGQGSWSRPWALYSLKKWGSRYLNY